MQGSRLDSQQLQKSLKDSINFKDQVPKYALLSYVTKLGIDYNFGSVLSKKIAQSKSENNSSKMFCRTTKWSTGGVVLEQANATLKQ